MLEPPLVGEAGASCSHLPLAPPRFRPVVGLRSAAPSAPPRFSAAKARPSAAQAIGRRFEAKVQRALLAAWPSYVVGPWFSFVDAFGKRWCQPDGLLHRGDHILVVEIKSTFSSDAWWQLERLYRPVLEEAFGLPVRLAAVARSINPGCGDWPGGFDLVMSIDELLESAKPARPAAGEGASREAGAEGLRLRVLLWPR